MPEGSLSANIQTLQEAFSAILGLLGAAPEGESPGTGLAGAAGLASTSPVSQVQSFGSTFTDRVSGLLQFDGAAGVGALTDLFESLGTEAQGAPTDALGSFQSLVTQVDSVLLGDFVERLTQTLDAVRSISENVPENRAGIFSALLDQIVNVVGSLEGEEAVTIRSWLSSLQEFYSQIMPIIQMAQDAQDPGSIVVQVMQRSTDRLLELIGFADARGLLDFLDKFPGNALGAETLDGLGSAMGLVSSAYGDLHANVDGAYPAFRDAVATVGNTMQDLRARLRPVLGIIRRIATARILQPHALENYLREKMEAVLAIPVQEVQRIDDPFNALFDRIDEAIEGVDLSVVRTEVLGFFDTLQDTIEGVDVGSIGVNLQEQLTTVQDAVQSIQQGVTDLLAQIEAFFDGLTGRLRDLASHVGTFGEDGIFQYNVEDQLRQLFTTARQAIGGDPGDPGAPSLAGSLEGFRASVDGFLTQVTGMLEPVESSLETSRATVVNGISTFSHYLEGLNVPDLVEQLRQKVEEIVDALVPIDFDLVVDPVVAEIEESTRKLRDVDAESLNALLKEALKVALDLIIQIDFTVAVSDPLQEQFETVKAVPRDAIEQLQVRYEQAMSILDHLKPEKFLETLFAAFDIIDEAMGVLDVGTLLQPLDGLHEQYLQQPLAGLKPSVLLQPVSDAFESFTSVFAEISGQEILAPLTAELDALKSKVTDLDVTSWIDDIIAAVAKVKSDLQDIRPSELLQPLTDELQRLQGELDRFRPSVLFEPVLEMAGPLLQFLDSIQQETIDALHEIFQAPRQILERFNPEQLTQHIQQELDRVIGLVRAVDLPTRFNGMKAAHFDLQLAAQTQGVQARMVMVGFLDPERQMGDLVRAYNDILSTLESVRENMALPDMAELYGELQERLLGFLPPFARELLDPETFKRLMRLADPTRFLQELDERFEALQQRLLPVSPQDIAGELDATYDSVLALVDGLEVEDTLNAVKDSIENIKGILNTVRIDFLAADIDKAVGDIRRLVDGMDPSRIFGDLDAIHHEVELVVDSTLPSEILSGLQAPLDAVQSLVRSVDPRAALGPPLHDAWASVEGVLDAIDFTVILSPIVEKLDELEAQFVAGLQRTENAFDQMLGAARGALGSGAGTGAHIGGSI